MDEIVPGAVAKHVGRSKLEEAIFKATQSKPLPAKVKHERTIIGETWTTYTAKHIFNEIFVRPLGGKEVVTWKTLTLLHKLMREGHPSCLEEAYLRKDLFESLKSQYAGVQTQWGLLDTAYLEYLIAKSVLHKENPLVNGEINLNKFKEGIKNFDPNKAIFLANSLLDVQKVLLSFQEKVLSMLGLDPCRLAAVVSCLQDCYAMYTLSEYLLKKVQEVSDLDITPIIDIFLKQFPVVQGFLFKCSTIPYIRQSVTSPPLLDKPPTFKTGTAGTFKKPDPKPVEKAPTEKKKSNSLATTDPFIGPSSITSIGNPFQQQQQQQQLQQQQLQQQQLQQQYQQQLQYQQLQQQQLQQQQLQQQQLQQQQLQQQYLQQQQQQQQQNYLLAQQQAKPKDPFSDLFSLGKQLNFSNETPQQPSGDSLANLPAGAKVHYVRPDETRDALIHKIQFLEKRVSELENEIKDIDGQNNELRLLTSERESGLAAVRAQMEERMKLQQKQFVDANARLKSHLESTYNKYEKDKLALVVDQIDFDRKFVEQMLFRFDNPNHLGNRGSTAEDIAQTLKNVQSGYEALLKTVETGAPIGGVTRNLVNATSKLMEDTKGALNRITDQNLRLQLQTGARNAARDIGQLLSHSISIVSQPGGKAEPRQMDYLKGEQTKFNQNLTAISSAVTQSQNVLRRDPYATNLESLADQELNTAMKSLSELLNSITLQNKSRPAVAPGQLDVGHTIGKASSSIIQTISVLVGTASALQNERLKTELSGSAGEDFHRDPMWTEALVNASRGVVNGAKLLVNASGNCTSTKIDGNALKEASRAIAASTTQLVAASRANNKGKTQSNLDTAAEAVTRATHELVEAANSFSNAEQIEIMSNTHSSADTVHDEIELQAEILRVEKELNRARMALVQMKSSRSSTPQQSLMGSAINAPLPNSFSGSLSETNSLNSSLSSNSQSIGGSGGGNPFF